MLTKADQQAQDGLKDFITEVKKKKKISKSELLLEKRVLNFLMYRLRSLKRA